MSDRPCLSFNSSGNFKIMIITDIQDGLHVSPYTMELITKALDSEKPDLVILGGDNICGFAPSLYFSAKHVRQSISAFLKPITDQNIPFCVVFGNHDTNKTMSKAEQMEYFLSFDHCYAQYGAISDRIGNYHLLLKDGNKEKDIFNLWFMDSGEYADDKITNGYAYITSEQIAWYEEESEDKYYVINPELVRMGSMEEAPCPPDTNSGQFESWKKQGDILAAFFGHDHLNDFDSTYGGIRLIYTPGAGFYSYGKKGGHGVRIIELNEHDLLHFKTRMVYFRDVSEQVVPWYVERIGTQIISVMTGIVLLVFLFFIILCRKIMTLPNHTFKKS